MRPFYTGVFIGAYVNITATLFEKSIIWMAIVGIVLIIASNILLREWENE